MCSAHELVLALHAEITPGSKWCGARNWTWVDHSQGKDLNSVLSFQFGIFLIFFIYLPIYHRRVKFYLNIKCFMYYKAINYQFVYNTVILGIPCSNINPPHQSGFPSLESPEVHPPT